MESIHFSSIGHRHFSTIRQMQSAIGCLFYCSVNCLHCQFALLILFSCTPGIVISCHVNTPILKVYLKLVAATFGKMLVQVIFRGIHKVEKISLRNVTAHGHPFKCNCTATKETYTAFSDTAQLKKKRKYLSYYKPRSRHHRPSRAAVAVCGVTFHKATNHAEWPAKSPCSF